MRKVLLVFLVGLILIQFIRPKKNASGDFTNDYTTVMQVSEEVKEIIKNSCGDCHSNRTEYPWYSEIAPVSWYVALHINEGKEHLNFSEWSAYNSNQKDHIIKDLEEELEEQKMPLKSYLIIHKEAKLTPKQYEILLAWVKSIKTE
jgi:hypothetical protein